MYKHVYVPVDNSEHSNRAIDLAVELGKAFGARLTGSHVYAARLHDYGSSRWSTRSRGIQGRERARAPAQDPRFADRHGLQLISESYLDVMKVKAEAAASPSPRK